jgi:hypothetical protein
MPEKYLVKLVIFHSELLVYQAGQSQSKSSRLHQSQSKKRHSQGGTEDFMKLLTKRKNRAVARCCPSRCHDYCYMHTNITILSGFIRDERFVWWFFFGYI